MQLCVAAAETARVRFRAHRLAEDSFALSPFTPRQRRDVWGVGISHRLLQLDLHRVRDNTRCIVANPHDGAIQHVAFRFGRFVGVLADTDRHAVNVEELGEIPGCVLLEQIRPRENAHERLTRRIARNRFVLVKNPAEWQQRRAVRRPVA